MRQATLVLSVVIAALGVAMIVVAIGREDVLRAIVGLLFVAAGAGRFHLARRGA